MTIVNYPRRINPMFPNTDWKQTNIYSTTQPIPEFKPKKAGTKTAHVIFVLDDSASMRSVRDETITGFNEFLKEQQESEVETYASLYKFNGYDVKCVFDHVNVKSIEPLNHDTYNPNGMTNLHDAIGHVMNKVNNRLSETKKKHRDQVQIVILTDGQENASKYYNANMIKPMVEQAESKDWTFMFLGANIDAFAVGSAYGLRSEATLQYNVNNMTSTMKAASRMTRDMSVMKSAGLSLNDAYASAAFTNEERKEAE